MARRRRSGPRASKAEAKLVDGSSWRGGRGRARPWEESALTHSPERLWPPVLMVSHLGLEREGLRHLGTKPSKEGDVSL